MSDNDSIKRGNLKKQVLEYVRTHIVPTVTGVLALIDDAPAVPQEMTVSEFARARNRMCLFHLPFCNGCTVLPERKECGEVIRDCPLWTLRDTEKAVAVVKEWALEHPERSEDDGVD